MRRKEERMDVNEGKTKKKRKTLTVDYPLENVVLPRFRRKVEGGDPSETTLLSLLHVMGLLSIQDFYLSGNMYQEISISAWYPSHRIHYPSLSLSRSHHLHHTTASFRYASLPLFSRLKYSHSPTFFITVTHT